MGTTAGARSFAAGAAALLALSLLSGCWLGEPVGDPASPEPITVTPTPMGTDRLEVAAQACGTEDSAPAGDVSFLGTSSWANGAILPADMRVAVSLTVSLESTHGDHSVDLVDTRGTVIDADGTVVGVVVGLTAPDGASGGAAYSGQIYVTLGACAGGSRAVGDPLPDGDYSLVLSGAVRAVDHDHVAPEYWLADPLPFSVADGEIVLPAD